MGAMKHFPQKLRELRDSAGLNQSQLADKLGVSRGSISFYENGDRVPDIEFLAKVAKYFNVSTEWLLGLSDVRSTTADIQQICKYTGLSQKSAEELHQMQVTKAGFSIPHIFINHFFSSSAGSIFKTSVWRAAAAEIIEELCQEKESEDVPLAVYSTLDADERVEYMKHINAKRKQQEDRINQHFFDQMEGTEALDEGICISPAETGTLYYHRALTWLEAVLGVTIASVADLLSKNRPRRSNTESGKDAV